jgi:hypothetical protein
MSHLSSGEHVTKESSKDGGLGHSGGEAIADLGGKPTWHNHKKLESSVVNAIVSTLRKVNCGSTCKRYIAGLFQNKALSSVMVHIQEAVRIDLVRQRKNGPTFLYI